MNNSSQSSTDSKHLAFINALQNLLSEYLDVDTLQDFLFLNSSNDSQVVSLSECLVSKIEDILNKNTMQSEHLAFIKAFQEILDEKREPESLDVQKAASAAEVLTQRIRDILEKIQALDVLGDDISVVELCENAVALPLRRYVEQCKKPWLQDKLTIALMGHLKTGKTSAMNCYFGEEFPTSSEEATALATYLYYGNNSNNTASLVDKEGGIQEISSEQMQLFSLERSFNFPFARMFSYIAKKSTHPALVDKTFIDTPGLFSSNSEHAYTTYKVLDYCDVIFWFIDSRKSISDTEISFIKECADNKSIYIIFSFVDARGTTPDDITIAQDEIKRRLDKEKIEIKGYLQFGRKENTQVKFKKDFDETIKSLSDNYQAINPIDTVLSLLKILQQIVQTKIQNLTKEMNDEKAEIGILQNRINSVARALSSAWSSTYNSLNSVYDTLKNKCAKVRLCTGDAFYTLSGNVRQLSSSINSLENASEIFDYDSIIKLGNLSKNIAIKEEKISRLDVINQNINILLNAFVR